ncbi:HSP20 domain-containing protein/ARID domain-containing protein [Cephalotus follicularis]|uniref:HSP20 domain-containing protein/ARID domain-containing protein n=1 Tax=Cephalotus follicularis TaxID=3775 RepID=A0A1Q3BCU7_CEPFO|nr:HSP20 domain-containing protein/ARID domain-containing protein [Cephalotus follicularis]
MGDTEMREQEMPNVADIDLVDASVQHQEATYLVENQKPSENGPPHHLEITADKTLTFPSEVNLGGNQVLSDKQDDKRTADVNQTNASDVRFDGVPVNQSHANGSHAENKQEGATPPPRVEAVTRKVRDENVSKSKNWLNSTEMGEAGDLGTPEEQAAFMKELETFYRENVLDFKPPKFYGEPLNCLKLWRAVIRLGGYELVTASKLWRQVGESFHPPKTCTTVSWTFRIFYEKALLEYEKHKRENGELPPSSLVQPASVEKETSGYHQVTGSGRARRDAAARAMQGWHAQRLLGYGEVGEPIIKDKSSNSAPRREKHLKNIGLPKHKIPTNFELAEKHAHTEADKQLITEVVDVGPPADWVKINVRETKDCFEVYALVPGLLREEVRVQSDPAGRLVITGEPEQLDNPWGITPFKKVVSLPAKINPLQTSAVVSLHGRLFVRVPFE